MRSQTACLMTVKLLTFNKIVRPVARVSLVDVPKGNWELTAIFHVVGAKVVNEVSQALELLNELLSRSPSCQPVKVPFHYVFWQIPVEQHNKDNILKWLSKCFILI